VVHFKANHDGHARRSGSRQKFLAVPLSVMLEEIEERRDLTDLED
jgi:hypothetical protein